MTGERSGRVLAIDPGTVRVGVAVSDSARQMAFPREAVAAGPSLVDTLVQLIDDEAPVTVVVGLPLTLDGQRAQAAASATALFEQLQRRLEGTGIEVVQHDERLTTKVAARQMTASGTSQRAGRSRIDSAAASVLLQGFLDGGSR